MPQFDPTKLEAAIERALAPFERLLPPKTLERMREQMREYATTHSYPVALLRQISAEPVVQDSHTRATEDEAGQAVPARRLDGTGGAKR